MPWSLQPIIQEFQDGKELYIKKICEEKGASSAVIYQKPSTTTIEIEIPDDEEFNPQKAAPVTAAWVYPDSAVQHPLVGLLYGNKVFPLYPNDRDYQNSEKIWFYEVMKAENTIEYTNETASEEQLKDASTLPVLVFRYQTLSYNFEPGEWFDADDYPDLEGSGVISAVNDEGEGKVFISQDSIEYINMDEMTEILEDDGLTDYEITLSATEKEYVLLNTASKPEKVRMLETIAAIWEDSHGNCKYAPVFDKLIFREIYRSSDDYTRNYDFFLDNGKIYKLPEGKFDEIVAGLTEEDQELNKGITPFGEYEGE